MKKNLFGLIAMVLFSGMSFGQTISETSKKSVLNSQMVTLVNVAKNFYTRGQSYEGFVEAMLIPSPTVPSQELLFRKVYFYVSNNTLDCDIMKADNSVLTTFANDLTKSSRNQSTYDRALGTPPKKWWQIAINWVLNAAVTIISVAEGLPPLPIIDLWP